MAKAFKNPASVNVAASWTLADTVRFTKSAAAEVTCKSWLLGVMSAGVAATTAAILAAAIPAVSAVLFAICRSFLERLVMCSWDPQSERKLREL